MKKLLSISALFCLAFFTACNEPTTQNSTLTATPTAVPVVEKIAAEVVQSETVATEISEEAKEKTAIIPEKEAKQSVQKEKVTIAQPAGTKTAKKVENPSTQPTSTNKAASVPVVKAEEKVVEVAPIAPEITKPAPVKPAIIAFSHDAWNALLQKNVSAKGKVNYQGFKAQKAALQSYLDALAANVPTNETPKKDAMAYWINAYNAFTIKLIVDNYPIGSITKLDGGKPWDKKWIKLGDQTYSLNNIENDILRPKYKDARIHFAVNCAAQSCPPILNKAWTATNLNSNFEQQAKAFVNNPKFNKITAEAIEISKIFEWYGSDFGNIVDYLNKYATTKINPNAKVSYMEYDWALNE